MAILGVLTALALVVPGGADDTVLVSRADGPSGAKAEVADELGDNSSSEIAISGDGRSVAFTTQADNLSKDAPSSYFPVLVRDLRRDRTIYVSRASGARGAGANNSSYAPALSGDGSVVAFHSDATNLDPADRSERADVYVRDLRTNRTVLVSRATGARGAHANGSSEGASISADGRYVAFVSRARNLHPDDTDGRRDVFVRDLRRNVTRLVSQGSGEALEPTISADGQHVAFVYRRDSLLPEDGNPYRDVYVSDLRTGQLTLVTVGSNGRSAYEPVVSADGRYVAFESNATNLHPDDTDDADDVYVRRVSGGS